MRKTMVPLILMLAVFTVAAPGCITDPVTGKRVIGLPTSTEEEIAQGNSYAPSFKSQYEGAYPDADLQDYCGQIVLGMAKKSHRPDLPWNFTILNSSEVNAFALPGGTVCITRGLLWRLDDEAEFAGVMGHEIGHVTHRHSVQSAGRQAIFAGLITLAGVAAQQSDSEWADLGVTLGAVGGQLLLLKYSRGQESESDEMGVEYSYEAGYDPREMADVFRTFEKLKAGQDSAPVWLSTHPLDQDRIDAIDRMVEKDIPDVGSRSLVKTTPAWNQKLARLRAAQKVYDDYDAANRRYAEAAKAGDAAGMRAVLPAIRSCQQRLPGHALFVSAEGVILHRLGDTATAKRKFEAAIAVQDDLFEPHAHLAAIAYERGDAATTLREGERARELFPHHPMPYYFVGRTLDRQGKTAEAAKYYQAVVELAPEDSDEYRFSAGRLKELGAASTP